MTAVEAKSQRLARVIALCQIAAAPTVEMR